MSPRLILPTCQLFVYGSTLSGVAQQPALNFHLFMVPFNAPTSNAAVPESANGTTLPTDENARM